MNFDPYNSNPYEQNTEPISPAPAEASEFSSAPPPPAFVPPVKPHREKKPIGRGFIVAVIAVSIVLSTCLGGAAGFIVARSAGNSGSSNGTNTGITLPGGDEALSVADVSAACGGSVVAITTESVVTGQFMQQYVSKGAGSGVVLSKDGYIVTNHHVINGANSITVTTSDGKEYKAKLVGSSATNDVALIKVEADNLLAATIGDSEKIVVGQAAIVIGNPLGTLAGTVTNGVISALDREITLDGVTMNLLQTNAAVNPGNSGGALFDSTGKLVGIINAKSSGEEIEGIGFAIPINDVMTVVKQLKENGYVEGGLKLGITMINITDAQTAANYRVSALGVYVTKITPGSLAEKHGIKVGDRLVALNGEEIASASEIVSYMQKAKAGDILTMTVSRAGKMMDIKIDIQP